ncbi:MAG: carboxylating nicotinate-nucleotide diphosphorylase [Bacteroidetes bacterium]|nr:carboxylating nicotinate-nucleotide diphosphorylase [Bacteroidota bacterium]MDA1225126.1 carboxylating nicotinate-nucleotide diphosphorylase [Bacteroidota bacterium]
MDFRSKEIIELIDRCFAEDIGSGDHSSLASIPQGTVGESRLLLKQDGVFAGLELGEIILRRLDPNLEWVAMAKDGDYLLSGTQLASARGNVHALLAGERLMLNFMQRLSGVATQTYNAVEIVRGTGATILDTRKTTPGLRLLEKWAVSMGGGKNHRIGLYDMVMLKDNHNDSAGGITAAVNRTKAYLLEKGLNLGIEVETRNMDEVNEVLAVGGVQCIMLDNFSPSACVEAVKVIADRCETEASGGINLGNLRSYAETGVDFISLGSLTHSVSSLDISFKTKVI